MWPVPERSQCSPGVLCAPIPQFPFNYSFLLLSRPCRFADKWDVFRMLLGFAGAVGNGETCERSLGAECSPGHTFPRPLLPLLPSHHGNCVNAGFG